MSIDLFTNGGTYLQTFETIEECALWFGDTKEYIKYVIERSGRTKRNGIFYRIGWHKNEGKVTENS